MDKPEPRPGDTGPAKVKVNEGSEGTKVETKVSVDLFFHLSVKSTCESDSEIR